MNIFALDQEPEIAAQMHCDKHVVKMIIEYAQLMSTAHRMIDGKEQVLSVNGKPKKFRRLWHESASVGLVPQKSIDGQDSIMKEEIIIKDRMCYNATHANHPSAIWARECDGNYRWLYRLFTELVTEYTHRYGKTHKTYETYGKFLSYVPYNLRGGQRTEFPQTMPDEFKHKDSCIAYQNFYNGPKAKFATWKNRSVPTWFTGETNVTNL